jgi:curved DNA-binding protein CbpA
MWQRFSLEFSSRTEDTHYRILGVSRGATNEEIRSAFKARALQFHPDKNPNNLEAEIKIRLINQAIAVRQSFIHSYLSTLK